MFAQGSARKDFAESFYTEDAEAWRNALLAQGTTLTVTLTPTPTLTPTLTLTLTPTPNAGKRPSPTSARRCYTRTTARRAGKW